MHYEEIVCSREGPVCRLTLNRPEKVNALSQKMIGEMITAFSSIAENESIRVVIIGSAGHHFCAGHDLTEMVGRGVRDHKAIFDRCTRMMRMIHTLPQPVIAEVRGVATAAGCQLVAWCDLAVAEEGARFATPGVKIGLFCTTPMVALTRAIGRKAAMEMLLTGRYVPAAEARELGLINRVVPLETLSGETDALARRIAGASRLVLAIGKQGFYEQIDQSDRQAMAYATQTIALNLSAEDAQNGIRAFLEGETPTWKNR